MCPADPRYCRETQVTDCFLARWRSCCVSYAVSGGVNQLVAPSDQTEKNSTEMGWCGCDCWCHSLVGSNLILMVSWGWVWDCDLSHSTADLGPQFPSKHDIVTIHTEKEREEWPTQDSPFLLLPVQDSMINYILSCAWG